MVLMMTIKNNNSAPFIHIVGARPNFIKLAPLFHELNGEYEQIVIHTGQHYDKRMSGDFFDTLGLPEPDINLAVGSGSHAEQTAKIMLGLEQHFIRLSPAAVIVYGDVNSTLAASLVASKLNIKVVHVEAGLRSYDRGMPEELNRLVTDQLSDFLLIPSMDASENLRKEGVHKDKIFFVGNIMIDTLVRLLPEARKLDLDGLPNQFALVTLHRPSNVDDAEKLGEIASNLIEISKIIPVVFPVHPRTKSRLKDLAIDLESNAITLIDPVDYVRFLALQLNARVVITDSGGIQEETTYLGTPCLTLRENTERPVTIEIGTNTLLGEDSSRIKPQLEKILRGDYKKGSIPEYWDGKTASRIKLVLKEIIERGC